MKVAVVGAGACGLGAIKTCLEEGLDVVCFERRSDIGGLWKYSDETKKDQSAVMRSTVANISKENMSYSDFLPPKEFPVYLPHKRQWEYFRMYAEHFQLVPRIRFGTDVVRVKQTKDFEATGRWEITWRKVDGSEETTEVFDAVMICVGYNAKQFRPNFEGEEIFEGKIIHSENYRHADQYRDKTVVVIGSSYSALDAATELAEVCNQVYLSTRHGILMVSRVWQYGEPWEYYYLPRFWHFYNETRDSICRLWRTWGYKLQHRIDHAFYGMEPDTPIHGPYLAISDALPSKLLSGQVVLRPGIQRLTRKGVIFTNGTIVDNVDAIICATGYSLAFPYVEHEAFKLKNRNQIEFYNLIFPPEIQPATIAVIGAVFSFMGIHAASELQSRYAARVFKGLIKLPSAQSMRKAVDKDLKIAQNSDAPAHRMYLYRDYVEYADILAREIGCRPPGFFHLLLTDPRLAIAVYFTMLTGHQFRLVGPGAWSGARDAVLNIEQRLEYPLTGCNGWKPSKRRSESNWFRRIVLLLLFGGIITGLAARRHNHIQWNQAWKWVTGSGIRGRF